MEFVSGKPYPHLKPLDTNRNALNESIKKHIRVPAC